MATGPVSVKKTLPSHKQSVDLWDLTGMMLTLPDGFMGMQMYNVVTLRFKKVIEFCECHTVTWVNYMICKLCLDNFTYLKKSPCPIAGEQTKLKIMHRE